MWPNFKLFQAFIVVLVTCKNEEDPFKMKVLVFTRFSQIITIWEVSVAMETRVLDYSNPIRPKPIAAFPQPQ